MTSALLHEAGRPGATHTRIALTAWLGWLAVFQALLAFFQLSLLYRGPLGLDDGGVANLKSLVLAATGVGGLGFGAFADRAGRRTAMIGSLALYALATAAAAAAGGAAMLFACAALAGLGIGGQWAAGQTLLGETVPPALRGRFGALAQTGAPLGLGLATLMCTQLAPRIGWRPVLLLAALPALPVAWLLARIPESDLWQAWRAGTRERTGLAALLSPGVRGVFALAFVLTFFNMASYWFTSSWLPEFIGRAWHLGLVKSGAWTLVFVAGSLTGYAGFGVASDRIGRRASFTAFSILMAAALLPLTLWPGAFQARPAALFACLFLAGAGTGTWSAYGALYTELFPTRVRNTAGGICMNVSRGAQFVAPLLIVRIGGQALGHGIALAAAFSLAAAAWVWTLPETHGRTLGPAGGVSRRAA